MTDIPAWSLRGTVGTCPTDGCGLLRHHPEPCELDMGAPTPTDEGDLT